MIIITEYAAMLLAEVQKGLGDPVSWPDPVEFPDSLALCALNSVYSLRASSSAARKVMHRYRAHREALGANPDCDSGSDLLQTIEQAGVQNALLWRFCRTQQNLATPAAIKPKGYTRM